MIRSIEFVTVHLLYLKYRNKYCITLVIGEYQQFMGLFLY